MKTKNGGAAGRNATGDGEGAKGTGIPLGRGGDKTSKASDGHDGDGNHQGTEARTEESLSKGRRKRDGLREMTARVVHSSQGGTQDHTVDQQKLSESLGRAWARVCREACKGDEACKKGDTK